MVDIGAALGIRGPSLYKHVTSKQELLAEIMTETMTTLIARQRAAVDAGGPPGVQLRRVTEAHVRYHATHREQALVGNREIESLEEPTRAQVVGLRSTYEHGLRAIIEQGCAAGVFSTAHPRRRPTRPAPAVARASAGNDGTRQQQDVGTRTARIASPQRPVRLP